MNNGPKAVNTCKLKKKINSVVQQIEPMKFEHHLVINNLVVVAVRLKVVGTRLVVEEFTELCRLSVVKGLTRWLTTPTALYGTLGPRCDRVERLVWWWRCTQNVTIIWLHRSILSDLVGRRQHAQNEDSKRHLDEHLGFTDRHWLCPCDTCRQHSAALILAFSCMDVHWSLWPFISSVGLSTLGEVNFG